MKLLKKALAHGAIWLVGGPFIVVVWFFTMLGHVFAHVGDALMNLHGDVREDLEEWSNQ